MGVHFDAFKGKKSKPETPGKEPKPRASLDPQDAARAAEMEWVTFAKHLRLEVAEEFEIPENVSALGSDQPIYFFVDNSKIDIHFLGQSNSGAPAHTAMYGRCVADTSQSRAGGPHQPGFRRGGERGVLGGIGDLVHSWRARPARGE